MLLNQLVKARDTMNRRQNERLIIVETAIYRVFVMNRLPTEIPLIG